MKKKIAILGSTGSIGKKAVAVAARLSDRFEVSALTANTDASTLIAQARELRPAFVGLTGLDGCDMIGLPKGTKVGFTQKALLEACDGADIVLLSVVGIAGLPAFEYCLKHGIAIALATKEAMVCGGRLARDLMDSTGTPVLPVDSELSAIFQCLEGNRKPDVRSILLTASGGPFREASKEFIAAATPEQAVAHPNWSMGAKISVDSATMMNKGLEILETRWLFDIPADRIKVYVHPQSIVHSMVEYVDGSVMAQMAVPDMTLAIQHALCYPERVPSGVDALNLFEVAKLTFEPADTERFPCLALAYEAEKHDGSLQLVMNSANEVAVSLFLHREIGFMDILRIVESTMQAFDDVRLTSFDEIYRLDREVRRYAASTYSGRELYIMSK